MKKLVRVLVILVLIVIAWQYFGPKTGENDTSTKNIFLPTNDEGTDSQANQEVIEEAVPFVPEKPLAEVSEDVVEKTSIDELVRGDAVYTLAPNSQVRRRLADAENVYERTTVVEKGSAGVDGSALVDGYFEIAIAPSDTENLTIPEDLFTTWFQTNDYPSAIMTIEEGGGTKLQALLQINGITKRVDMPSLIIIEDDSLIVTIDTSLDLSERGVDTDSATSDFVDMSMQLTFSRTE